MVVIIGDNLTQLTTKEKGWESMCINLEKSISEVGNKILLFRAHTYLKMDKVSKVLQRMVNKDMANIIMQMEMCMKENGKMISKMEKE